MQTITNRSIQFPQLQKRDYFPHYLTAGIFCLTAVGSWFSNMLGIWQLPSQEKSVDTAQVVAMSENENRKKFISAYTHVQAEIQSKLRHVDTISFPIADDGRVAAMHVADGVWKLSGTFETTVAYDMAHDSTYTAKVKDLGNGEWEVWNLSISDPPRDPNKDLIAAMKQASAH